MKTFIFGIAALLLLNLTVSTSDFEKDLNWLKRRAVVTKKISPGQFERLEPLFIHLLKRDIYKEDVFAILNYLLRQRLDADQQLMTFIEIINSLNHNLLSSKGLRNFISKQIKIATTQKKSKHELFVFLIDKIRNFKPEDTYKRSRH